MSATDHSVAATTQSCSFEPALEARSVSRQLPAHTSITNVTPPLLPSYRRLISTHLPIRYPDKFYALSTSDPAATGSIALCAVYDPPQSSQQIAPGLGLAQGPQIVGSCQARLEPIVNSLLSPQLYHPTSQINPAANNSSPENGNQLQKQEHAIYIQTIATSPSHRTLGVGTCLLETLIHTAIAMLGHLKIKVVYAHVWEVNTDALEWYLHRDFTVAEKVEHYYRKLRPGGATIVKRDVTMRDYMEALSEEERRKDTLK